MKALYKQGETVVKVFMHNVVFIAVIFLSHVESIIAVLYVRRHTERSSAGVVLRY
jgi:hypothetical protein